MKRLHVHVSVEDLQHSIGFYSALFAAEPAVVKPDYAKWMLEDPRVNFAISTRGRQPGLDHLGIQVESKDELHEVYARLHKAGGEVIEQGETACCYAKSEKSWIDDPAGIAWETFHTIGEFDRLWRWHGRTRGPGRQREGVLRAEAAVKDGRLLLRRIANKFVGPGRPNSAALQRHDPGLIPSLFISDSRISFVIGKKPLRSVCSWPSLDRTYFTNSARNGIERLARLSVDVDIQIPRDRVLS